MSMVPLLFRDWWDDIDAHRPSRLLDQHFGLSLTRDDLFKSIADIPRIPFPNRYYRPWGELLRSDDSGSSITSDKNKFQVILDVQQFAPHEITVKTLNNSITVEGKHEEKQDEHGYISRQFVRRYVLPQDHDVEKLVSSLSSDGVLTITAPKTNAIENVREKIVPIAQTGPIKALTNGSNKNY